VLNSLRKSAINIVLRNLTSACVEAFHAPSQALPPAESSPTDAGRVSDLRNIQRTTLPTQPDNQRASRLKPGLHAVTQTTAFPTQAIDSCAAQGGTHRKRYKCHRIRSHSTSHDPVHMGHWQARAGRTHIRSMVSGLIAHARRVLAHPHGMDCTANLPRAPSRARLEVPGAAARVAQLLDDARVDGVRERHVCARGRASHIRLLHALLALARPAVGQG